MIRQIINIDEEKCDGCGICAEACHESAIAVINGKAKLLRDDHCDGMGDCLPSCPRGAISFDTREAAPYDEAAVEADRIRKEAAAAVIPHACPGSAMRQIIRPASDAPASGPAIPQVASQLKNWPVQLKLAPVRAPYFDGAKLLVAADCTAYAYAGFHNDLIRGKTVLIGCPKLDSIDYSEKLTEIIRDNDISSVTIVRMEVPCCGGLEMAVRKAIQASGRFLPWQVMTVSIDGDISD